MGTLSWSSIPLSAYILMRRLSSQVILLVCYTQNYPSLRLWWSDFFSVPLAILSEWKAWPGKAIGILSCSSQSVPKISSIEWNNGSSWALFSPKGGAAAPHLMGHMERITAHFSHTAPHRGGAALGRSSFERRYGCDFFFGSILCSQTMNNWLGIGRKTYTWCDQWCGNFVVGGGCRQRAVAARLVGVGLPRFGVFRGH